MNYHRATSSLYIYIKVFFAFLSFAFEMHVEERGF